MFAKQVGLSITYDKLEAPLEGFAESVRNFFTQPASLGCNVTVPFKEQAAALADSLDDAASLAGAVNTLKRLPDRRLAGFNTDGLGLVADIQQQGISLADKAVLIIGAGGASRGVIHPLLNEGVTTLAITNRTEHKAKKLCEEVSDSRVMALGSAGLMSYTPDIVINSTSASLSDSLPDVQHIAFNACELAYDMVYQQRATVFMRHASHHGARHTADGLGMLVAQAAAAFTIWTERQVQTRPVIKALRAQLAATSAK